MGGVSVTNREFAIAVGCSTTTASRMRNGERAPSVSMLLCVVQAYKLDEVEALREARSASRWGAYLRNAVFSRTHAPASAHTPRAEGTVQGVPGGYQNAHLHEEA